MVVAVVVVVVVVVVVMVVVVVVVVVVAVRGCGSISRIVVWRCGSIVVVAAVVAVGCRL